MVRFCGVRAEVPEGEVSGEFPLACFHRILTGETPFTSESLARAINASVEPTRDNTEALCRADDDFVHDATLAAFQAGGMAWVHFNRAMKKAVVETQVREGPEAGSWDPPEGGSRVRSTALRTATLTVYYRYPRLFRR